MDQSGIRDIANRMADAARAAILPHFRHGTLRADNKEADGFDPVTEADRAGERAMRDILARERPQDAILGEEYGKTRGSSGLTWVLDPVDGTRSFISGVPLWGVLIAACDNSGPVHGLIDQPYIGERFEGGFGHAAMSGPHGQVPLRTRGDRPLSQATLMSTYPDLGAPDDTAAFRRVQEQVRMTRFGTDCYAYALLAAGHVDLVIEAGLQSYDICAPIAVVQAAGGIVTDWTGGPAHHGGRVIAAAGRQQHDEALALLAQI